MYSLNHCAHAARGNQLEFQMKNLFIATIMSVCAFSANAYCTGSGSFRTCTDTNSGNTYSTQTIGNSSYTTGSNANTGNTWSQTSTNVGNTTYHNGTAANGNTWSGTSTTIGNTTYHNGTDSRGNPYSSTTHNPD